MIARVLPDLPAVDRPFDYLVPDAVRDQVRVGSLVRIELHGRRVGGWVVDLAGDDASEVAPERLKALAKLSSDGPPPEVVSLAAWAAWRWAGRWVHLLRAASPPANVHTAVPPPRPTVSSRSASWCGAWRPRRTACPWSSRPRPWARPSWWCRGSSLPPAWPTGCGARAIAPPCSPATCGPPTTPSPRRARPPSWARGRRCGLPSRTPPSARCWCSTSTTRPSNPNRHPRGTPERSPSSGPAGPGCRAPWCRPCPRSPRWRPGPRAPPASSCRPTWMRGSGAVGPSSRWSTGARRSRGRGSLFTSRLVDLLRADGRVVCVLNRIGRARLLGCTACGTIADCERCGAAVSMLGDAELVCGHCGTTRPVVCAACGSGRFKNLRMGVTRAREELEALAGEPVAEVTASSASDELPSERIVIGTEAVLHRLPAASASVVAFLDLDQELLAPRDRAAEQAMALLARASRVAGARRGGGRLLLQTRHPDHAAVQAVALGDPGRLTASEAQRRSYLMLPPFGAAALVSGPGATEWAAGAPDVDGIQVLDGPDATWMVRAPNPELLADFLELVPRPPERTRIEVDPPRL